MNFVLEVLVANVMAALPAAMAEQVQTELLSAWDRAYGGTPTADPDVIERTRRQLDAARAFTERLTRKALRRADGLRRQRAANTN